MKDKVLILGANGMLGSMVLNVLSKEQTLVVSATNREDNLETKSAYPSVAFKKLDAEIATVTDIESVIKDSDWIINCIGIIKPYIHDDNYNEIVRAIKVNSLFPHNLAKAAEKTGSKVIQIATDCVYSGQKGKYVEDDLHDAIDVYGKSKSLGEVNYSTVYNLRCSIIGPEAKGKVSLLEWFLKQPEGAKLNGYSNHQWNGITTFHFAKICQGIIKDEFNYTKNLQHVIPKDTLSKYELLKSFQSYYDRKDIKISSVQAPDIINRTISTNDIDTNKNIWRYAGYNDPPTIDQMIKEMAHFSHRQKG